jgi:hypothetical protein
MNRSLPTYVKTSAGSALGLTGAVPGIALKERRLVAPNNRGEDCSKYQVILPSFLLDPRPSTIDSRLFPLFLGACLLPARRSSDPSERRRVSCIFQPSSTPPLSGSARELTTYDSPACAKALAGRRLTTYILHFSSFAFGNFLLHS